MRFCSKPPALTNTHAGNQRLVQQSDHVRYDHTFNEIATSQRFKRSFHELDTGCVFVYIS